MPTIRCYTSPHEVWQAIEEACLDHEVKVERDGGASACLNLGKSLAAPLITLATSLPPHHNICTDLTAHIMLHPRAKRCLLLLFLLGSLNFVAALLLYNLSSTSVALLGIVPGLVSALCFSSYFLISRPATRTAHRILSTLMLHLSKSTKVLQLSPIIFRDNVVTPYSFLVFCLAISSITLLFAGPIFTATVALLFFVAIVFWFSHNRLMNSWQGVLSAIQSCWTFFCLFCILPLILLFFVACVQCTIANYHKPSGFSFPSPINEILSRGYRDSIRLEYSLFPFAQAVTRSITPSWLLLASLGIFLVGYGILLLLGLDRLLSSSDYWRSVYAAKLAHSKPILPSSEKSTRPIATNILLLLHCVLSAMIHWLAAILSLDIIVYVWSGKSWLLKPLGLTMAVFDANVQYLLRPFQSVGRVLADLVLLTLAVPGTVLLGTASFRLYTFLKREGSFLAYERPKTEPRLVQADSWIESICRLHRMKPPVLAIRRTPGPLVWCEASVCGLGSRIVASPDYHKLFSDREFQALLTHEIYHAAYDAQTIATLKLFSILLLFPAYYLVIFYDFQQREKNADSFAVSVIGDSKPVVSAVVKAAMGGRIRSVLAATESLVKNPRPNTRLGQRLRLVSAVSLLFDDALFAAAYPALPERLAALTALSDCSQRTAEAKEDRCE